MPALRDLFPGIPLVESPLFAAMIDELDLSPIERRVAVDLNRQGYAVIDFPDPELDSRIERMKAYLNPLFGGDMEDPASIKAGGETRRVQDGWIYNDDIRAVAANPAVLDLLAKLYGRRPFPFQTLNFPVGTQQPLHSDSIHFSCIPERFMCGVWLALEDIHADAGPLTYLPGSHAWPILSNAMIGRRGFGSERSSAQRPFQAAWDALVAASGIEQDVFLARKGQALIWAANLLHGGSAQRDPTLTRWSQVTHYYFEDCIYYTPAFSDEALGQLDLRGVVNVATGKPAGNIAVPRKKPSLMTRMRHARQLPPDFDADAYCQLNPDVAAADLDPAEHYIHHGKGEGRHYQFRERS